MNADRKNRSALVLLTLAGVLSLSDWMYMRSDKMVGNETLKPLLKKMPSEKAEGLRSLMADPQEK